MRAGARDQACLRRSPKRNYQHIPMRRRRRIQWGNRRHAMEYTGVVHERAIEGTGQGEAAQQGAVGGMNSRRSTGDIFPIDQQHQDVIDAIAMHAFGGWLSWFARSGFDPELMHFDMPLARIPSQHSEKATTELKNRSQ